MGRKLLIGAGAVFLVVLALSLGAVAVVTWRPDVLRGRIEQLAGSSLGAPVHIRGPIRIDPGRVATVEVGGIEVAAPEWAAAPNLVTIDRLRVGLDLWAWLTESRVLVTELVLEAPRLALERDMEGRTSWPSAQDDGRPAGKPEIRGLSIHGGSVSYNDAVADVQVVARVATPASQAGIVDGVVQVEAEGTARGRPVEAAGLLSIDGQAIAGRELAVDWGAIRIEGDAVYDVGKLVIDPLRIDLMKGSASGRVALAGIETGDLEGDLALRAEGVDLAASLPDRGVGGIIEAEITGKLRGSDLATLLTRSELHLTASVADPVLPQAQGEVSGVALTADLAAGGERPLTLQAKALVNGEPVGIDIAGGPLDRLLAAPISYPLRVDARLVGTEARLDGTAAWPLTAGGLDMTLAMRTDGLDLTRMLGEDSAFGGTIAGTADGHLRGGSVSEILSRSRLDAEGELTRLRLPQLEGRLEAATFELHMAPERERPLDLAFKGKLDDRPVELTARTGAIGDLAKSDGTRLPVHAEARLGDTEASAEGTVDWPPRRGGLQLDVKLAGPDPAQILGPLGLAEIKLPPYRLAGRLVRQGDRWGVEDLDGKVGDSDVSGEVGIDLAGERPKLDGSLHSRQLDLDDLLGLVGAEPGMGSGETASRQQKAEARGKAADDEVLPDQRLDPASWRRLDIDLALTADKVTAGVVPLDGFDLRARMEAGKLRVDPMTLRLGEGKIGGTVQVDGSREQPTAQLELDVTRLPVARLLQRLDVDTSSVATLSGRARGDVGLGGRGRSVAEILGTADGSLTLVMEGGKISRRYVDMLGFDILNLFGSLLGTTPSELTLNCSLADLAIKDGVVSTRSLVFDTDAASLAGEGTIDLAKESIDIELLARPKGTPLPSGRTGIAITGTLAEPKVSYDAGALAARGAAAATFGLFLRPFTAVASALMPQSEPAGHSTCARLLKPAEGG